MAASKVLSTGIPYTAPPANNVRPESDRSNHLLDANINCFDHIHLNNSTDHEPAAAAASSSSSLNQQHVTMEINDTKEHTTSSSVGISSMFKELEIGKTAMGYVPSALVALLINTAAFPRLALYMVVIAFSFGLTLTWNGIMLRNHDLFKRFGCLSEQIGVVVVFMGFFGLVASILPLALVWVPLLCGIFFMLPFIQRFLPSAKLIATSRRPPLLPS